MARWVFAALAVLALAGCEQHASQPYQPFKTDLTTKDLMKHAIDPAADIVWAASGYVVDANGTTELSPKTTEGWAVVENNATIVAELANSLMLPGRAPEEPQWNAFAQQLHTAAVAAKNAAVARDKEGLLRTGGDIYAACTACHKRYVLGEK